VRLDTQSPILNCRAIFLFFNLKELFKKKLRKHRRGKKGAHQCPGRFGPFVGPDLDYIFERESKILTAGSLLIRRRGSKCAIS
jgi:hypothetical protein